MLFCDNVFNTLAAIPLCVEIPNPMTDNLTNPNKREIG
jgi:hypothetical protein